MNFFDQRDCWSSQIIANGAKEYLEAAKQLQENPLTGPKPYWFCVFQSIELSLKAYLRGCGLSKEDLKSRKFGHKIGALLQQADEHGLKELVSLDDQERAIINETGELYNSKVFQYREAGWTSVPYAYLGTALAEKIYEAIKPFAKERMEYHYDKETAVTKN